MASRRWAWLLLAALAGTAWGAVTETAKDISAEFAVPAGKVQAAHDDSGLSWKEVRTALILSKETGMSLDDIAGLRRAGVSFEDIAQRHRLDLDEAVAAYERQRSASRRQGLRQAPGRREEPAEGDRIQALAERHGVTGDDILALRRAGLDLDSMDEAFRLAARTGRTPYEIADMRRAGMSWEEIERVGRRATKGSVEEERPLWDSPDNPFRHEDRGSERDWRLYRGADPGFPREQTGPDTERPVQ